MGAGYSWRLNLVLALAFGAAQASAAGFGALDLGRCVYAPSPAPVAAPSKRSRRTFFAAACMSWSSYGTRGALSRVLAWPAAGVEPQGGSWDRHNPAL